MSSTTPIHNMVEAHAVAANEKSTLDYIARHQDKPPKLHCSGMDRCVRQAYLTTFQHAEDHPLQRPVSHPFSTYLLRLFELGKMYEAQLHLEVCSTLRSGDIEWDSRRLGIGAWSGRPDFLIHPCDQFPEGAIIDCKATGAYQFAYTKQRIPRLGDCLQVLAYQHFMSYEHEDFFPEAYLYYRQWYNYGEFHVWERHGTIYWEGGIGGKGKHNPMSGEYDTCLKDAMYRLEAWWKYASDVTALQGRFKDPLFDLPGYSDPFESTFGCLRTMKGKWWSCCRWLSECWPRFEVGDRGPFEKPEEEVNEEEF